MGIPILVRWRLYIESAPGYMQELIQPQPKYGHISLIPTQFLYNMIYFLITLQIYHYHSHYAYANKGWSVSQPK